MAVTENDPALFSVNDVDAADVNTGGPVATVRVKAWVAVLAFPSVAVMVMWHVPAVGKGGRH